MVCHLDLFTIFYIEEWWSFNCMVGHLDLLYIDCFFSYRRVMVIQFAASSMILVARLSRPDAKASDWQNYIDQACSCQRDWRLSTSWGPNWGPLKPIIHHSTIALSGVRRPLLGYPSCRETLVSRIVNVSFLLYLVSSVYSEIQKIYQNGNNDNFWDIIRTVQCRHHLDIFCAKISKYPHVYTLQL